MYNEPRRILIVKTSSLGDIVQTFDVLNDLRLRFPNAEIDWAVEAPFYSIVATHPLVSKAIPLHIKKNRSFWRDFKSLRKDKYDLVFDLQGNCKSGLVTLLSRGKIKVGYGIKSVREWPNILSTHVRFEVSKKMNIRHFYLALIESYFKTKTQGEIEGVEFRIQPEEKKQLDLILKQFPSQIKIMVCPGAKWVNKQIPLETMARFLEMIQTKYRAALYLIWGSCEEKEFCNQIQSRMPQNSVVIDKLPIPVWQNLMSRVDLVIAVDSSALHICATTATPSFSIFGPTSPEVFKPLGKHHYAFQGPCPYDKRFEKQCPLLRTCPTGACIRGLSADQLFDAFNQWISGEGQNLRGFQQL